MKEKNVRLFTTHKIYSETELHARYEIETTMLEMVNTDILPAVSDYTAKPWDGRRKERCGQRCRRL